MEHGDFTELAKFYVNRPGYSKEVLACLRDHIFNSIGQGKVADIGAGTGKLTENLVEIGLDGYAVEPNAAMRAEAAKIGGGEKKYFLGQREQLRQPDCRIIALNGC